MVDRHGELDALPAHPRRESCDLGRTSNHAVTGADMADLSGQVQAAWRGRALYVTILMGANDVCASSEASMTPTATFRAQLEQSLATLSTGLPDARIFISSIPDIYQLFSIYRYNLGAVSVWSAAGICQSMLANPLSNAAADVDRRARVRQRNIDYNTQLAAACALYVHCRFDGNAGFNTAFVRADVTTRDYFHPSVAGQRSSPASAGPRARPSTSATSPRRARSRRLRPRRAERS